MKFDLKRPCKNCPFLADKSYLSAPRVREITASLARATFPCHKTIDYDEDGDATLGLPHEQHCAGALIMMEKNDTPGQMLRIAQRLGIYDPSKLDMTSPVYDDPKAMERGHDTLWRKAK